MILHLQAGTVTLMANAWSAGANPGGRVTILAHGGTIGLTLTMAEFLTTLSTARPGSILNLSKFCEDPTETMERLARGE